MSGDPMKLVKFMCATKSHNTSRSESALTIHEGVWAFCYAGGQTPGHDWQPVDGLPLNDAMRFAQPLPNTPSRAAPPPAASASAKADGSAGVPPKERKARSR
jgi:hypothetical protein